MIEKKEQSRRLMTDVQVTTLKNVIDTCYKGDSKKVMDVFKCNLKEFVESRKTNDIKNMLSCLVIVAIAGDALLNSHGIKEERLASILYKKTKILGNDKVNWWIQLN